MNKKWQHKMKVLNGGVFYEGKKLNVGHVEKPLGPCIVHINGATLRHHLLASDGNVVNFKKAVTEFLNLKRREAAFGEDKNIRHRARVFLRRAEIDW